MKHRVIILVAIAFCSVVRAQFQPTGQLFLTVVNPDRSVLPGTTVELLQSNDSSLVKAAVTDSLGRVIFQKLLAGDYLCRVSRINYQPYYTSFISITPDAAVAYPAIVLQPVQQELQSVTVAARKPFVELMPGKTIVNVEAGISNAGATALEVLEKSPGVAVDRNGGISLKGRPGVLILLDGKPTYMSGDNLITLLSGMNAAQLETIEIMDHPPAKYDAAGNGGVINIKLKKNRQQGFNGSLNLALRQGRYTKYMTQLQLNYRNGPANIFFSYSYDRYPNLVDLYANRTYYDADLKTVIASLEQPYFSKHVSSTHNTRTGIDYALSKKTTIGLSLAGTYIDRFNDGNARVEWKDPAGNTDSVIFTSSHNSSLWRNGNINLGLQHNFKAGEDLSIDLDYVGYNINGDQYFLNNLQAPGGYSEATRGDLPTSIRILAAQADYTNSFGKDIKLEAGWKSSHVDTDNQAIYSKNNGGNWEPDLDKTNHFLYEESINALYASVNKKFTRLSLDAGLRYEQTRYNANQLGNDARKDSSFSRDYNSLFPTFNLTYELDSLNNLFFSTNRRIDRPSFNKLNPFVYIINKYTNQQGNPFFKPQYTWNFSIGHQFKNLLITEFGYHLTKDYFSQVFLTNSNDGTIIYTEGNLDRMENISLSISVQARPRPWLSFSIQLTGNNKRIRGFIERDYRASINQLFVNMNHQLQFGKGWSAEVSGYYVTRNQNDIQEILEPAGQLTLGFAKNLFKNKGTLKCSFRDIFYSQIMAGWSYFQQSIEYFKLHWDTRLATLTFTYRFGKPYKSSSRRNGSASDVMNRVNVNN